jgi:hypothetical protein
MKTVSEWLLNHNACYAEYRWAMENCKTMTEVWNTAKPELLIWVATRPGVLDDITLRRYACFCARQVWDLLTDERSKNAIIVAERFCDGKVTKKELEAAEQAAGAAGAAARKEVATAWAEWAAAWAVWVAEAAAETRAAATWAAETATWAARKARVMALETRVAEAAGEAQVAATWVAEAQVAATWVAEKRMEDVQTNWLRNNCKPNFE